MITKAKFFWTRCYWKSNQYGNQTVTYLHVNNEHVKVIQYSSFLPKYKVPINL